MRSQYLRPILRSQILKPNLRSQILRPLLHQSCDCYFFTIFRPQFLWKKASLKVLSYIYKILQNHTNIDANTNQTKIFYTYIYQRSIILTKLTKQIKKISSVQPRVSSTATINMRNPRSHQGFTMCSQCIPSNHLCFQDIQSKKPNGDPTPYHGVPNNNGKSTLQIKQNHVIKTID